MSQAVYRIAPMEPTELLLVDPSANPTAAQGVQLWYRPSDDTLGVATTYQSDTAIPAAQYYGHVLAWGLPSTVDARRLADEINAGALDVSLARIHAGSDRHWTGNNHVTRYDADAQEAIGQIGHWCENQAPTLAGDAPGVWDARDWFRQWDADDIGIVAGTTDAALAEFADRELGDAAREGVVVSGALELFTEWRDELRDAER